MRNYQMATILNPSIVKQSFKVIEIPLRKFSEEVVPHHQNNYEQYRATIHKLISVSDIEQVRKETKDKKKAIKQLNDLISELDTLRTQVEDENLDKFDSKTLSLRRVLFDLVNGYSELEKAADMIISLSQNRTESSNKNPHPFEEAAQIQIMENIDELKLRQQREQLSHVESVHRDVEDLHAMYDNLNGMIGEQRDDLENIAENVNKAQQNVENGTKDLRKAHRMTAVAYPVTGAFLGGIIGGPIGLVAGMKVGGIAALGFAVAGYTGGKWIKRNNENLTSEMDSKESSEKPEDGGTSQKKKI